MRKRFVYQATALLTAIFVPLACIAGLGQKGGAKPMKKALVVYLTRTKNTQAIAEVIHRKVGGDVVPIELVTPYPADYKATVAQVVLEDESGYLPSLRTKIPRMERYDVVFVGFPTWDMKMPPPMKSFLHRFSLKGKTVAPFDTNAGYGVGSGIERDGKLLVITGAREEDAQTRVDRWLRKIKVL